MVNWRRPPCVRTSRGRCRVLHAPWTAMAGCRRCAHGLAWFTVFHCTLPRERFRECGAACRGKGALPPHACPCPASGNPVCVAVLGRFPAVAPPRCQFLRLLLPCLGGPRHSVDWPGRGAAGTHPSKPLDAALLPVSVCLPPPSALTALHHHTSALTAHTSGTISKPVLCCVCWCASFCAPTAVCHAARRQTPPPRPGTICTISFSAIFVVVVFSASVCAHICRRTDTRTDVTAFSGVHCPLCTHCHALPHTFRCVSHCSSPHVHYRESQTPLRSGRPAP